MTDDLTTRLRALLNRVPDSDAVIIDKTDLLVLLDEAARIEALEASLAERDADDLLRSEEGRTDWDYGQKIAARDAVIAEAVAAWYTGMTQADDGHYMAADDEAVENAMYRIWDALSRVPQGAAELSVDALLAAAALEPLPLEDDPTWKMLTATEGAAEADTRVVVIDLLNGSLAICGRCGDEAEGPHDLLDHLCDVHGICGHDD